MQYNNDVMHVEKKLFDNLFYMLMGIKGKRIKIMLKVENTTLHCNWLKLELIDNGNCILMPKATYSMSWENVDLVQFLPTLDIMLLGYIVMCGINFI